MRLPVTISLYFGRHFAAATAAMLAGLAGLAALFDFLELLRESAVAPLASFAIIAEIELLRVPWVVLQVLPFGVLLGGIYAFWRLARFSELVVARAAGISAWQFLAVPVLLATFFGAFATGAISPISAVMYSRAEILDDAFLHNGSGPLSLNGSQLWVRQADTGLVPNGVAVLHAADVHLQGKILHADTVSVLRLNDQTALLARIDAAHATLTGGNWHLEGAVTLRPDLPAQYTGALDFATDLTVNRVQQSFASPNALSFWALPGFIALLQRSGFTSTQHELAFQSLCALPLLCATMALVAAGFSMRPSRR